MSYSLGAGEKYYTVQDMAVYVMNKVLAINTPIGKIRELIPGTEIEAMMVNAFATMLAQEVADGVGLKDHPNTDNLAWKLSEKIGKFMASNGIIFSTDPTDTTYGINGMIWSAVIGSQSLPGFIPKQISKAFEDLIKEMTGMEATTTGEEDVWTGGTTGDTWTGVIGTLDPYKPGKFYIIDQPPGVAVGPKPKPSLVAGLAGIPIELIAAGALAAIILLKKKG